MRNVFDCVHFVDIQTCSVYDGFIPLRFITC